MVNKLLMKNCFFLIAFITGCSKIENNVPHKNSFEEKLISKIDYVLDSTNCNDNRILQVRHEKYKGNDYIQIASGYDYEIDSLYYCLEYRGNFIAIYNKDFFNKKIKLMQSKKESLLSKYHSYNSKNSNGEIFDKKCFEIFEISNGNFNKISHNSYQYNNLFSIPPTILPPPPPKDIE